VSATHRVPVLLAVTGQPFEEALLAALARPGSRLRVGRRCLDLVDLLAAASTRTAPVAVVWDGLHRLDGEAVSRLAACGVATFGVVCSQDAAREAWLADLGVVGVAHAFPRPGQTGHDADPDPTALAAELTGLILAMLPAGTLPAAPLPPGYAGPPGPVPVDAPTELPGTAGGGQASGPPGGRLVAVWGPIGAPGRTTVAVTLADELARQGTSTLVADADTYGPSVAQRLGILDEASGLATAVRAANAGTLDRDALARAARSVTGGLRVLTGLTRADRWPELPGSALSTVWRGCRTIADVVVVDCGFCLEEDDELAYDGLSLRRNGATLTTLAAADLLVVVGSADPVGLARLLRGIRELADLAERRPAAVPVRQRAVVTQVRSGPVGRNPARQVAGALAGTAGLADPVLVADDRPAHDQMLATGRTLAEVAPRSPARAALGRLAREIGGDLATRAGRPWTARPRA
jgi:MinD-like ATPase involved in chromosome partitioning or flagellar assembly